MLNMFSDVSDNEDDSEGEENNKNSRNKNNKASNTAGIKGQKNIKDCFVSLDTLKMENKGDLKSKIKTQKVSIKLWFFFNFCL